MPAIPLLRSEELFGQSREILIEHSGCYYRLRLTHSNKLILTK
jgi:hemin uptake protein HemP